jgi:hypothetical protein
MTYDEIAALVEKSIEGLKVDPALCRGQKKGQWSLKLKDASVWIDVFNFETNPDRWYFQVMSPLLAVPDRNKEAFFQDLLEINYSLYGTSICKRDGWFYVLHLREAIGIDQGEIDRAVDRVGAYSTEYWAKLDFKYKGNWDPKTDTNSGGRAS